MVAQCWATFTKNISKIARHFALQFKVSCKQNKFCATSKRPYGPWPAEGSSSAIQVWTQPQNFLQDDNEISFSVHMHLIESQFSEYWRSVAAILRFRDRGGRSDRGRVDWNNPKLVGNFHETKTAVNLKFMTILVPLHTVQFVEPSRKAYRIWLSCELWCSMITTFPERFQLHCTS